MLRTACVLAIVSLAGCSRKEEALPVVDHFLELDVELTKNYGVPSSATIFKDGVALGTHGSVLTLPSDRALGGTGTKLVATYETSCGPVSVDVSTGMSADSELRERVIGSEVKDHPRKLKLSPRNAPLRHSRILVLDNRDHDAVSLTIGALTIPVGAGERKIVDVSVGSCPTAYDVRIGKELVGTINWTEAMYKRVRGSQVDPAIGATQHYVIDVAGTHCYRVDKAVYGSVDDGSYFVNSAGAKPYTDYTSSAKRRIHEVTYINEFFAPNPPRIEYGHVSQSLVDRVCAKS